MTYKKRIVFKTWVDKDDNILKIRDMDTSHIISCLELLKRNGITKLRCLVNKEQYKWGNGLKQIKGFEAELQRRANGCPSEF